MSRFLGSKNFRISTNCCPAKMAAMSISAPTYFFTDKPKSNLLIREKTAITLNILISSFLEIDFAINISDKKSRRFDLSEVIFKCIKVL